MINVSVSKSVFIEHKNSIIHAKITGKKIEVIKKHLDTFDSKHNCNLCIFELDNKATKKETESVLRLAVN